MVFRSCFSASDIETAHTALQEHYAGGNHDRDSPKWFSRLASWRAGRRAEAGCGPVLDRILRGSARDPPGPPRGRTAGMARQMGRLWRGALRGGACRSQRPPDVLFEPWRGPERFRQGKAVASAKHHSRGGPSGAYQDARSAEPGAVADGDER